MDHQTKETALVIKLWHECPYNFTGVINKNKSYYWLVNGVHHREDGPAIEWSNGDREWYINGKRHRDNGPAFEYAAGAKVWWSNGQRHRDDGPACVFLYSKEWFLNGMRYSQEEWFDRLTPEQQIKFLFNMGQW